MKKILAIAYITLLSFTTFAQNYNQNVNFTRTTLLSGKTMVQDTSLYIKSGNDTIRITNYGGFSRIIAKKRFSIYSDSTSFISVSDNEGYTQFLNIGRESTIGLNLIGNELILTKGGWIAGFRNVNTSSYADIMRSVVGMTRSGVGRLIGAESSHGQNDLTLNLVDSASEFGSHIELSKDSISFYLDDESENIYAQFTASPLGFTLNENDSVTIYATTPANGTQIYCSDCSGNGITGRIVAYIGAAWRRLTFED